MIFLTDHERITCEYLKKERGFVVFSKDGLIIPIRITNILKISKVCSVCFCDPCDCH